MRAAWWWIDRWRSSTAYTDMTLAEQGAYRNLLDELWLRGGVLPDDDRILGRICGDPVAWPSVKAAVLAHFVKTPEGWRNETHDAVRAESEKRAERQKRYRDSHRNAGHNEQRNVTPNVAPSPSLDLSLSPDQDLDQSPKTQTCRQEPTGGSSQERVLPAFVTIWNEVMAGSRLPTVRVWSAARDRVLKARLAEESDLALWRVAMERLRDSPHHRGENDRGWVAGIDFLLQASQAPKWLDAARAPVLVEDPEMTPQLRRLMGGVS